MACLQSRYRAQTCLYSLDDCRRFLSAILDPPYQPPQPVGRCDRPRKGGTLPLDIDLLCMGYPGIFTALGYINTVINLAERWQYLNIQWFSAYEGDNKALLNLLRTPAPKLKELQFNGFSNTLNTVNLFDGIAPNLDTITTEFTVPNWTSFVMKGLRKLAVSAVEVGRKDFEDFVQALVASPNMEDLQIRAWVPRSGGLLEESPIKIQPITFKFLRLLALRTFPLTWASALLEAVRIPHLCSMNIVWEVSSSGSPLFEPLQHLRERLTNSSLLNVVLDAPDQCPGVLFECEGTEEAAKSSVAFHYPAGMAFRYTEILQLWQRSLTEIHQSVRASGIRVHLTLSVDLLHPPTSLQPVLTSTLKLADELLPSVYWFRIRGVELQQVMESVTLLTFPNLAHLEVDGIQRAPWEEMLKFVSARSELAAIPDSKIQALQSISLPRDSIDEEGVQKLSSVVEHVKLH